jgi:MSHA pilin protein MshA
MKTIHKTQQGFTLVELIIVIVILGILAVTAAPRFLNFTGDARVSVLNSAAGAIKAGNSLVYGKSAIAGLTGAALSCYAPATQTVVAAVTAEITANGTEALVPVTNCVAASDTIDLRFGYLDADAPSFAAALDLADFAIVDANAQTPALTVPLTAGEIRIAGSEADLNPAVAGTGCYLTYTEATAANTEPTVVVVDNACN